MCSHLVHCQLTGGAEEGATVLLGRIMSVLFMCFWNLLMGPGIPWGAQGGWQCGGHHLRLSLFWRMPSIRCPWNKEAVQKGSRQTKKRCCIAADGDGSLKPEWNWKGTTNVRCPAKKAALLCCLLSKTELNLCLSFSICWVSFFFLPSCSIFKPCGSAYCGLQNT